MPSSFPGPSANFVSIRFPSAVTAGRGRTRIRRVSSAQGTVDNFVVTLPELAHNFTGGFTNGVWQTRVTTYTDRHYTLQRSTNFTTWSDVDGLGDG